MPIRSSLFEPSGSDPVANAVNWITDTMLGSVAISLCVLAVAYVGLMMLTGHLSARVALRVILGCFVLLGAPVLASALMGLISQETAAPQAYVASPNTELGPREELPPADYDPYAGASHRSD
ncbi:TrbC/VirB2 family protein [Pontixanthobacter aestiaquae]|uniref:TrbC/VIRB2 family protein n=1 Tax=Pontixanthobacter aestiaquae TaxID=1509367 RepID=A0A844Z708_9SPHN|nr:TrbC/VirB2 family protein [Pontixanthobacter aestiaquae]MDN3647273.1 TrbC/VirB2 family protein [Pontixanthobacter aestiaquae]MXO84421.1 hypothetical protein [Pontixanthobacter aestiaquae]